MSRLSAVFALPLGLACFTLFASLVLSHPQTADLPPGRVRAKFDTACLECHDAGIIAQQRLSKAAWSKEVDKMIRWGAVADPGDRAEFIEYLSVSFPEDKKPYLAPRTAFKKTRPDR
jgi:hypothetical protein